MNVEVNRSGQIATAKVTGRVDSANAAAFDRELSGALIGDCISVILDCTALGYISSGGLRAILLTVKRAKSAGGSVALFGVAPHILEVLEVSGFTRLLAVSNSLESAREAVQG